MNVTSSISTSQVYVTNRTTDTKAVSAYESVAPVQKTDRMDEMQEKYKDVFIPMQLKYSEEIENAKTSAIREKYPNYLTFDERLQNYRIPYKSNITEQDKEKLKALGEAWTESNNKYIESLGGQDAYEASVQYSKEVGKDNPVNAWDRKGMNVSNSKELATFYNAGVYEGLEKGKSVEEASKIAFRAVDSYMDTSEHFNNTLGKIWGEAENWSRDKEVNYKHNIDLREYGFDMEPTTTKIFHNEKDMESFAQKKLDYFNFIVENQNIVDRKYNDIGSSYTNSRSSYQQVVKPVIEQYLPQAQVAVDVFSKYKIFDSIDIKA